MNKYFSPPETIAIVGAGTAGYLAALYLLKNFPKLKVNWYYPFSSKGIGVGEGTSPDVQDFLEKLGIDIDTIIKDADGVLKLGVIFQGFTGGDKSVDEYGNFFGDIPKARFLFKNKKVVIDKNDIRKDVLPSYASHMDTYKLQTIIDKMLVNEKRLCRFDKNIENIMDLQENLVLDATGFSKDLCLLDDNFKTIFDKIQNDTAYVIKHKYTDKKKQKIPYTVATVMDDGWVWKIPLKEEISMGYVCRKKENSKEMFINHLTNFLGIEVDGGLVREIPMECGRNEHHIYKNDGKVIFHVGLGSMFIEPLEATGLLFVIKAIEELEKYMNGDANISEVNSRLNGMYDKVVDFICAHYKYNEKSSSYWKKAGAIKLDIGGIMKEVEEQSELNYFPGEVSWNQILVGMGVKADTHPDVMTRFKIKAMATYPNYEEWLKKREGSV